MTLADRHRMYEDRAREITDQLRDIEQKQREARDNPLVLLDDIENPELWGFRQRYEAHQERIARYAELDARDPVVNSSTISTTAMHELRDALDQIRTRDELLAKYAPHAIGAAERALAGIARQGADAAVQYVSDVRSTFPVTLASFPDETVDVLDMIVRTLPGRPDNQRLGELAAGLRLSEQPLHEPGLAQAARAYDEMTGLARARFTLEVVMDTAATKTDRGTAIATYGAELYDAFSRSDERARELREERAALEDEQTRLTKRYEPEIVQRKRELVKEEGALMRQRDAVREELSAVMRAKLR